MRFYILFFFVLITITFNSCKQKANENIELNKSSSKPSLKAPKKQTIPIQKTADSIDKKNAVTFLKKYGNLNKEEFVLIKTRLGNIKIKLYNETPLHRASFIFLTKMGYFDTTCFYRVVPNFIIQGGESERLDTQAFKAKYQRYKIPPEFRKNIKHKYGAIALARDWENNPKKYSTAFEFYIVQNKEGAHHLDGEHTVFGEVISGFQAIDKIVNLKAGSDEWPLEDVFMKVEVIR